MTPYKITVADQNGLLNQVPTSIPTLQTAAVISSPEIVYANAVATAATTSASNATAAQTAAQAYALALQQTSLGRSVVEYGAVGDGATDCTTAINNAIAACVTNGWNLLIPAGTWACYGQLLIPVSAAKLVIIAHPLARIEKRFTTDLFTNADYQGAIANTNRPKWVEIIGGDWGSPYTTNSSDAVGEFSASAISYVDTSSGMLITGGIFNIYAETVRIIGCTFRGLGQGGRFVDVAGRDILIQRCWGGYSLRLGGCGGYRILAVDNFALIENCFGQSGDDVFQVVPSPSSNWAGKVVKRVTFRDCWGGSWFARGCVVGMTAAISTSAVYLNVTLSGTSGTVIANNSKVSDPSSGQQWTITPSTTIPSGGSRTVKAVAVRTAGVLPTATVGGVTRIDTPITGWSGVTNADAVLSALMDIPIGRVDFIGCKTFGTALASYIFNLDSSGGIESVNFIDCELTDVGTDATTTPFAVFVDGSDPLPGVPNGYNMSCVTFTRTKIIPGVKQALKQSGSVQRLEWINSTTSTPALAGSTAMACYQLDDLVIRGGSVQTGQGDSGWLMGSAVSSHQFVNRVLIDNHSVAQMDVADSGYVYGFVFNRTNNVLVRGRTRVSPKTSAVQPEYVRFANIKSTAGVVRFESIDATALTATYGASGLLFIDQTSPVATLFGSDCIGPSGYKFGAGLTQNISLASGATDIEWNGTSSLLRVTLSASVSILTITPAVTPTVPLVTVEVVNDGAGYTLTLKARVGSTGNIRMPSDCVVTEDRAWLALWDGVNGYPREIANPSLVGVVNSASYIAGGGYGTATGGATVNATNIAVGNTTANAFINSTSLYIGGNIIANSTGSNNSFNLGGISLTTIQSQITGNSATAYANAVANAAALYQTTAGLTANVLTLSSNNTTFFNGVTLSSVNNAITSNAAAAYANAVSYVTSQNYANTSQVSGNAATSYANAVAFASNASNITTGTLSFSVMNSNVVSNSQLQSNLSNYQTTAGLSANVLVLTANAAGFLGNSSGTIANVASWITGNSATAYSNAVANAAALYQTTAGLSANVATLTANNANNLGGVVAASYVNTSGAYTITGIHTYNANVFVNTASLLVGNATINTSITGATILINGVNVNTAITGNAATAYANAVANAAALYQTTAGLTANVAAYLPTYAGVVNGSSHTVGTNFVANATNILIGSTTAGANAFIANAIQLSVGNSTVNTSFSTTSITTQNTAFDIFAGANRQFRINYAASAVNYLQVSPAATGSGPSFNAQGADSNINLGLTGKGVGGVWISNNVATGIFDDAAILTVYNQASLANLATVSSVDTTNSVIVTTAAHGFSTGQAVYIRTTSTLPGNTNLFYLYYLNARSTTNVSLHTTLSNALAGTTNVIFTSTGSGTITLNPAQIQSVQRTSVGNFSKLMTLDYRNASGTNWTTATKRMSMIIDTTGQVYIDFNPPGLNNGLALGHAAEQASYYQFSRYGNTQFSSASVNSIFSYSQGGIPAFNSTTLNLAQGLSVNNVIMTAYGTYTSIPTATFSAPTGIGGFTATANAAVYIANIVVANGGSGYVNGDVYTVAGGTFTTAASGTVTTNTSGGVSSVTSINGGTYSVLPANGFSTSNTTGIGTGFTANVNTIGVNGATISNTGWGYIDTPTITFSGGGQTVAASAYVRVGTNQTTQIKTLGKNLNFATPAGLQLQVTDSAGSAGVGSTANYLTVTGAITGGTPAIAAAGSDSNVSITIAPKGSGAFYLGPVADNTVTGGTARGANAVDLQTSRNSNTQVASGAQSVLIGGVNNTAAGTQSTAVGGINNTVGGSFSTITGGVGNYINGVAARGGGRNCNDHSLYGADVFSSGQLAAQGDAQSGTYVLRGRSTSGGLARLSADGNAASSTNICNLPLNTIWSGTISVTARDTSTGNGCRWQISFGLGVGATVGTTTYVEGAVEFQNIIGTVGVNTQLTRAADTANRGLNFGFTPPNTNTWDIVAVIRTAEVQ